MSLYGYEAMSLVLAAIRAAGSRGNDRQLVTEHVFASTDAANRCSAATRSQPDGETTLTRFAVDRVARGRLRRSTGRSSASEPRRRGASRPQPTHLEAFDPPPQRSCRRRRSS